MQKITSTTIIKKGDIIRNTGRRKVIEVLGEIYFLSLLEHYDRFDSIYTIEDLIYFDYYLDDPVWSAKDLKEGDKYWYLADIGGVADSYWDNHEIDFFRLKMGLIVENEEAGRAKIKEIMEK